MSSGAEKQGAAAGQAEAQSASFLETAIKATKQTERSRAEELIRTLVEEATRGTVTFNKDVTRTINEAIAAIDATVSKQLGAIMHHPEFQKLEGSWRGLRYLVFNSETSAMLKLKVFNCKKSDLAKDLERAVEFDQSNMFKKMYENEFGSPGGEPYGALIGDFEFENLPEDIDMLGKISNVAAAAFCPFISAAAPRLFAFDDWTEMTKPRDLEKIFDTVEYTKWKSYRDSEDSRFVTLTMPRTLARLPYGTAPSMSKVEEFTFEEVEGAGGKKAKAIAHDNFCWMNSAYVLGTKLTDAFSKYGFCTAIRGAEGGGKVEGLPAFVFETDDGDMDLKCPTEIAITDRREAELSKLGFLPLCHYKNTDYSVFFGAQSTQKPKKYDRPEATANAAISARLPYLMATSRFAHYLKVIARDKIGSFQEKEDCAAWMNRWIMNYVSADPSPSQEVKARYPLRAAEVKVEEIPGKPGSYNAVVWMRPWLQLEELTTSMRMVASIPKKA
jgi:type VI secretion system protein ImpC